MLSYIIPTSTAGSLVANAVSLITDPGTLAVLLVCGGVPFGFWLAKKLIGLIPKR